MKALERKLGANTISDGNAGLGTTFTAIAHNMVKPGGRIALILPTAAMTGGSYDADKRQGQGQAYSWQRLRNLLCDNYDQIVVMSIAQPRKKDSAFSADSDFADCMVIARRLPAGARPGTEAHFISLKAVPATKLEAQETARVIKAAIRETDRPGSHRDITIGDEVVGTVSLDTIRRNRRWTNIRIANPGLVARLRQLEQGILRLPQSAADIAIPVSRIGAIGNVGPLHRDIAERGRGPFTKVDGCRSDHEYPMLWNHYPLKREAREGKDPQKSMLTRPDSHGRSIGWSRYGGSGNVAECYAPPHQHQVPVQRQLYRRRLHAAKVAGRRNVAYGKAGSAGAGKGAVRVAEQHAGHGNLLAGKRPGPGRTRRHHRNPHTGYSRAGCYTA